MGANSTQARAVALFFVAMVFIAGSFAANLNWVLLIVGLLTAAGSITLFLKCRPWELEER